MTVRRVLQIKNRLGLHARPAALFVKTAGKFKSDIRVSKGDVEVNGKSMMGLLMLAAEEGSSLNITLDGEDADEAIREIETLFARNFDE